MCDCLGHSTNFFSGHPWKSENAAVFSKLKYTRHQSCTEFVGKGVRAHVTIIHNGTSKIAKILRSGVQLLQYEYATVQ